jgi:hypothetical protein
MHNKWLTPAGCGLAPTLPGDDRGQNPKTGGQTRCHALQDYVVRAITAQRKRLF